MARTYRANGIFTYLYTLTIRSTNVRCFEQAIYILTQLVRMYE